MQPPLRHGVLHVLLRQVAVDDVSEQNLLDIVFLLFEFFCLNVKQGALEVNYEVPLWVYRGLKELYFFNEFSKVALHAKLGELADLWDCSVPRPELLVSSLDDVLVFWDLLKLCLELLGHVQGWAYDINGLFVWISIIRRVNHDLAFLTGWLCLLLTHHAVNVNLLGPI